MKTRTNKKMLSLILALMMVVCSIPIASISASGALDAQMGDATDSLEIVALEDACRNFNAALDTAAKTGVVFKDLSKAYETYLDARVYCDLALIGDNDGSEAEQKSEALKAVTESLAEYTKPTFVTAPADGSYTADILTAGDQISNVLYTDGVGGNTAYTATGTIDNVSAGFQYGASVVLYDGENDIALPISAFYSRSNGTGTQRLRSLCVNTSGLELRHYWHGNGSSAAGYQTGNSINANYVSGSDPATPPGSRDATYRLSNTLYITGPFSDSRFVHTIDTINWHIERNGPSTDTDLYSIGINDSRAPIYIIDYQAIKNTLAKAADVFSQYGVNSLASSYAKQLFSAVDNLTSINLNQDYGRNVTISGQSSDWSGLATLMGDLETSLNNAASTINNLGTPAQANILFDLSGTVGAEKPIYDKTNEENLYTPESWSDFVVAYETARNAVRAVQTDGYTLTQDAIDGYISALRNAVTGLTYTAKVADTSRFDAERLFVSTLTSTYYTEESYQNLASVLAAETNVVYPNGLTELPIDDTSQPLVDAATAQVWAAIADLRLDTYVLEELIHQADAVDPNRYLVADLQVVVGEAEQKILELQQMPFPATPESYEGVEAQMLNDYLEMVNKLRDELNNLELAFTAIEDGTVVSSYEGTTAGLTGDDIHTYLQNEILDRTYFKTVSGTASYTTPYNYSVTNQYTYWGQGHGAQFHGLGFGGYGASKYQFGTDQMSILWKEGGAPLNGTNITTYMDALMKTPSTYTAGVNYVDVVKNRGEDNPVEIMGETTVTVGDLGIALKAFTTPDIYELINVRNQQRERTNNQVKQTITIIDVSDLFELIEEANNVLVTASNNSFGCYTEQTWTTFVDALAAAKANMEYGEMGNNEIVSELNNRYNVLNSAKNGLIKDTDISHHYYDPEQSTPATCLGTGTGICAICGYEAVLSPTGHDYTYTPVGNGHQHVIACSKGDIDTTTEECTDLEPQDNVCDICLGAVYTPANWENYNAAKAELLQMLQEGCTLESLNAAKPLIEALEYFNSTDEQKAVVSDALQDKIDAETASIQSIEEELVTADSNTYDAICYTVDNLNADAYNVEAVTKVKDEVEVSDPVTIFDVEYQGYHYDEAVTEIETAMNGENHYVYKVTVYDYDENPYYLTKDGTYTDDELADNIDFHYGDTVTVKNPINEEEACAWSVEVTAKKTDVTTAKKYVQHDTSYQFNVRGDTSVYSSAIEGGGLYKVVFVDSRNGRVVDIEYTSTRITFNNLDIPEVPFYTIEKFTNAATGENIKNILPKEDTRIIVNYVPSTEVGQYQITFTDLNSSQTVNTYKYNEKVTLEAPGAAAFVDAKTNKVLFYGSTYTFFACQTMEIKAVDSVGSDVEVSVISQPIISNDTAYFIGSFAAPENTNVRSYGIVLDVYGSRKELSLADVDKNAFVYNMAASKLTVGNQFVLSTSPLPSSPRNITYVAYVIYVDEKGIEHYAYSDVISTQISS